MIIKTKKPVWLSREHKSYMFEWKLPYIAQYQGYQRSWHFTCPQCNDSMKPEDEQLKGIVGYSEDNQGDIVVLHECPVCGTKWYNHLSHELDDDFNQSMLERQLANAEKYGVGNSELLIEPTLKSKIIDFSDCTTTDFRAAMAMEFYSIKCQFLIRT